MPSAVVKAAFDARMLEYTSGSPPEVDAITYGEPSGNAFVVIQFPIVDGSQPVLERHFQEEGAARLVLNVRRSAFDEYMAYEMADDLARIFRVRKFHDIETFVPSAPIVNDTNDDGNWFSLSVIVPYRYQFYDVDDEGPETGIANTAPHDMTVVWNDVGAGPGSFATFYFSSAGFWLADFTVVEDEADPLVWTLQADETGGGLALEALPLVPSSVRLVVAGNPVSPGDYDFAVRATDPGGLYVEQQFTITVTVV